MLDFNIAASLVRVENSMVFGVVDYGLTDKGLSLRSIMNFDATVWGGMTNERFQSNSYNNHQET